MRAPNSTGKHMIQRRAQRRFWAFDGKLHCVLYDTAYFRVDLLELHCLRPPGCHGLLAQPFHGIAFFPALNFFLTPIRRSRLALVLTKPALRHAFDRGWAPAIPDRL